MRTFTRQDLPRYTRWQETRTGPGQWDRISGTLLGRWTTLAQARAALVGKRLAYGLGFFADAESVDATPTAGGLTEVSFSASGLFAAKFRTLEGSTDDARSLEGVAHPFPASVIPATPANLEFRHATPTLDVVCAMRASDLANDYRDQGKPLNPSGTSTATHRILALAGRPNLPSVGTNPYTSGDFTYHYPYGWSFTLQPGDALGEGAERLLLVTYRFTFQWNKTL
jgi:hypothetical protein